MFIVLTTVSGPTIYYSMSLIKTNGGISPILESSFPDLFDTDKFFSTPFFRKEWRPAANVKETDNDFEIELASPGLSKDDFKINIDDSVLTISGEKEEEKSEATDNYSYKEFNYNSFNRSFSLPKNVKEDEISAKYDDGILRIVLPKSQTTVHNDVKEVAIA